MSWLVLTFIVSVALLAPFFGADTRDGRDWKPSTPSEPGERHEARARLRRTYSRVRPSAGRVPVAAARQARAGG
ncbi:MAG: hypothetical protein JWQ95_2063 [Sphaerisporangium sp.]|nr:hypothetical protein [Sphaerisporangium sp.]